jgi:fructose-1,6-bisphosphatase/inositol monophosphatase family enzyme
MKRPACATKDPGLSAKEMTTLRDTAIQAAFRAGEIHMLHFRDPLVAHAEALYDVKLETDRLCEEAIVQIIRSRYPDHSILAEEGGRQEGSGKCTWIIDPLDGTVNFWHGLPFFCTSIACYAKSAPHGPGKANAGDSRLGTPLVGVVRLPATDELFAAAAGMGATLNGKPIHPDADRRLNQVLVSVSFGKTPPAMQRMAATVADLLPRVRKVRCLGAAAAELAYVAAGYLGAVMYTNLKPWDFAAGKIILEEAGGSLKAVETQPDQWQVEAGGPGLEQALQALPGPDRGIAPALLANP